MKTEQADLINRYDDDETEFGVMPRLRWAMEQKAQGQGGVAELARAQIAYVMRTGYDQSKPTIY